MMWWERVFVISMSLSMWAWAVWPARVVRWYPKHEYTPTVTHRDGHFYALGECARCNRMKNEHR